MTDERQIEEIIKQYEKHGWILRRVLLSAPTTENLASAAFGEIEAFKADFDALWFSRPALNGGETWELRTVSAPFAIVEVFTDDDEEEVREEIRREMETQIANKASKNVEQKRGH